MRIRLLFLLALVTASAFAIGPTIPPSPWDDDAPGVTVSK